MGWDRVSFKKNIHQIHANLLLGKRCKWACFKMKYVADALS